MRSTKGLAATAMMLLSVPLAGCVHTVIQSSASPCSDLLPSSWLDQKTGQGTVAPAALPDSVKLPDGHDDARPWQKGFIEQTGQLETSNDRYGAAVGIVGRCEKRDAAAVKKARPKVLGIF